MPRPGRSLLGNTTMLRVAALLYLDPSTRRSLGELTRSLDGLHRLTVIRALNDLVEQGYVTKTEGNPPRYQPNQRHYLYEELRSIAIKTFGGFEDLAREIVDTPTIRYAAIYGSFARGDAGPTSDIDLLLVTRDAGDPDVIRTVSDLAAAAQTLGREINPTIYGVEEFASRRDSSFLRNVLDGPLVVLKQES